MANETWGSPGTSGGSAAWARSGGAGARGSPGGVRAGGRVLPSLSPPESGQQRLAVRPWQPGQRPGGRRRAPPARRPANTPGRRSFAAKGVHGPPSAPRAHGAAAMDAATRFRRGARPLPGARPHRAPTRGPLGHRQRDAVLSGLPATGLRCARQKVIVTFNAGAPTPATPRTRSQAPLTSPTPRLSVCLRSPPQCKETHSTCAYKRTWGPGNRGHGAPRNATSKTKLPLCVCVWKDGGGGGDEMRERKRSHSEITA